LFGIPLALGGHAVARVAGRWRDLPSLPGKRRWYFSPGPRSPSRWSPSPAGRSGRST